MFSIKQYKSFIVVCITLIQFNIIETYELPKLQNKIYQELHYTSINGLSNKITLFDIEYIIYAYFIPPADQKADEYIKLNLFYIFMNCSFAEWTQYKLFKFIRQFPLIYNSTFLNKYNNVFNKNYKILSENLSEIKNYIKRFINILLNNFLRLTYSRNYDTSFIKTLLLLKFKIHFLTLPSKNNKETTEVKTSDVVVIRSILRIMNLIQNFMVTNCNVYTPHEECQDNFIKSIDFFGLWITKSPKTNDLIDKILKYIENLKLEKRKSCYTQQMLLTHIVSETSDNIVSREISNAKVETKFGTILIYQILQQIKRQEGDLELVLWYQESIVDVILKLIYNKVITAINNNPSVIKDIITSIPNFINDYLPDSFLDSFTIEEYTTNAIIDLIHKITEIRDSITNIILETDNSTQFIEVSNFDEFITYISKSSEDFYCCFSLMKFLRNEFSKYYIPFLSNTTKFEHIVKYKDVPISETVPSDVNDKLLNSMCQYVRDLYSLCLELTTILNMIGGKEKHVIDEYLGEANTILTTIRERSVDIMKWCSYKEHKECSGLLKVSYDLYVVLSPMYSKHLEFHETPMITMVMSILNIYSIDHCNPPNFNFLLLKRTNFEDIGNYVVHERHWNTFVKSLGTNQNTGIISNYKTFLNIDIFFQTYVKNTDLFTKNKQAISFFWKGEKKSIEEVYKNIIEIIIHPSHVYAFYDLYFKFVIGMVYLKIRFILHNLTLVNKITFDIFSSDECDKFFDLCKVFLSTSNYPKHLSILASKVFELAELINELCVDKKLISKIYEGIEKKNDQDQTETAELDNEVSGEESSCYYQQLIFVMIELERLFEASGMFVKNIKHKMSFNDLLQNYVIKSKVVSELFVDKVFKDMNNNFLKSFVSAKLMLIDIIINI